MLERVWSYQANEGAHLRAAGVTRDARLGRGVHLLHRDALLEVGHPPNLKPEWSKYFHASGIYELVPSGDGITRRVVRGEVELRVPPFVRQLAERMIVSEVKKTFDAEAAILRELATLV